VPHVLLRGVPRTPDAHVKIDGVPAAVDGSEIDVALDPGDHEIVVEAAPRPPWSRRVHLDDGAPPLAIDVPPAPEPAIEPARPSAPAEAAREPAATGTPWRRIAALGVAGVGVAGLGVGTYFGLLAFSQWTDVKENCPKLPACPATEVQKASDARQSALVSTLSFAIGATAVAAGTALALWWAPAKDPSSPPPLTATPVVGDRTAGLVLQGVW
jgi:hypothetical protein